MARNRKLTNDKYVSDLMRPVPKSAYRRRATDKPDGRRCDDWVFEKRATLHHLGDVGLTLAADADRREADHVARRRVPAAEHVARHDVEGGADGGGGL